MVIRNSRIFWFLCLLFCGNLAAKASNVEIRIPHPPEKDTSKDKVLVPNEDGDYDEVDVDEAMNGYLPFFDLDADVYFELYTMNQSMDAPYYINVTNPYSIRSSPFNPNNPTRIAIHGWRSSGEMFKLLKEAYFTKSKKDINFFAVNWTEGAATFNYVSARRRVDEMGVQVSKLIKYLIEFGYLNVNDLTLIGHSLGAHIAGIAGKKLENYTIPIIIGLDPASPLFTVENEERRLAKTDAKYIEIIHSNAGLLGLSTPLGHASFYPNGGKKQPGCGWDLINRCAHSRSYIYYAESIFDTTGFYAWQCKSYDEMVEGKCSVKDSNKIVRMGSEMDDKGVTGIFYLQTNEESLFAQGMPNAN